jgi:sarcosine oxidase subunit alpha
VDALVVGAGPAGLAAAVELSRRGRQVELVDDDLVQGGSLRALDAKGRAPWSPLMAAVSAALALPPTAPGAVSLRLRVTAAGLYGDDLLLSGPDGVEVVTWKSLVLAPGTHDGTPCCEGNDTPGTLSARAGGLLLEAGVAPGRHVAIVVHHDEAQNAGDDATDDLRRHPFAAACARALPAAKLYSGKLVRIRGGARVRGAMLQTKRGPRSIDCDALLIDAPGAPAFELCAQAGGRLEHQPHGYVVRAGPDGAIRPGVYAVGEVTGVPLDPHVIAQQVRAIPDEAT